VGEPDPGRTGLALHALEVFVLGCALLSITNLIPLLFMRNDDIAQVVAVMDFFLAAFFFKDRAAGGLFLVLLIAIVVMEFGSVGILWADRTSPDANITSADDALWYSIATMSTVGYGDQYPVTDLGRLIGTLVIVIGVGVFGTLTGFLANAFLSPSKSDSKDAATQEPAPATQEPAPVTQAAAQRQEEALAAGPEPAA